MGRNNGTFNYKVIQDAEKDSDGFYNRPGGSDWIPGCECQIEKYIPAKQRIGTDGQMYSYSYEVFIPKHFRGDLELTAPVMLIGEDDSCDEITILGVDNHNRKYIAIWG